MCASISLSRLRKGLVRELVNDWRGPTAELMATVEAVNLVLDLEFAVLQAAFRAKHHRQLQRTERLATIGRVTGDVTPQLRSPLNALKRSVYFLRRERKLTAEKLGEHLGRITRHANRADSLVSALSDFAKVQAPELKPFNVASSIRHSEIAADLPGHIALQNKVPHDLKVLGDVEQFLIVLTNLLRNAVDAMPDGGTITIDAQQTGTLVNIRVCDTGIGINQDALPRIMEPLYTTKARGIGLGLATSRAIVEKHAGRITVESEPGRGSTFVVQLKSADSVSRSQGAVRGNCVFSMSAVDPRIQML